jgi:hypothetical protein
MYEAAWSRCRDCYEGQDQVKKRGEIYLPKPSGLDSVDYRAYKQRALFYEAVGRTVDGFVGAISRKDPTIEVPTSLEPVVKDATLDSLSLAEFAKKLCGETVLMGRGGVVVDYDEKARRAYLSFYAAESITNWSDTGIVLREFVYETDPEDRFKQVEVEQYRQLELLNGIYTVTLWRLPRNTDAPAMANDWRVHEMRRPSRRGMPLDKVPFFWLSPQGRTAKLEKPPLLGLVNVCMSHYMDSADLQHGLHFSGLPTPYITGVSDTDKPIKVGSLAAILLPDANCKVGYLEVQSNFAALFQSQDRKEAQMAVLGAAVFHDGKKGVEAAETARIRQSGERSLLSGVVTSVEETLQDAMECAGRWMMDSGAVKITMNREFVDTSLDGPMLTGLVQALQAGGLSLPQFLYNMQQADLLAPDTDLDEEAAVVQAEAAQRMKDQMSLANATKPQPKSGADA